MTLAIPLGKRIWVCNPWPELIFLSRQVFMELCFWKKAEEAWEIVNGYECETKTAKKSTWSEEDEEKLERVFRYNPPTPFVWMAPCDSESNLCRLHI